MKWLIFLVAMVGCVPKSMPVTKSATPADVNICDGQPHQFDDLLVTMTGYEIGDVIKIDLVVENKSEGAVFDPVADVKLMDEFGNDLHAANPAYAHNVKPGETYSVPITARAAVANAKSFTLKLSLVTGRNTDGKARWASASGTLSK